MDYKHLYKKYKSKYLKLRDEMSNNPSKNAKLDKMYSLKMLTKKVAEKEKVAKKSKVNDIAGIYTYIYNKFNMCNNSDIQITNKFAI